MPRGKLNLILDSLLLILAGGLVSTGFVLEFILPPGSGRMEGGRSGGAVRLLWGLDRHAWGNVHFWVAVGLLAGFAVHLILHWAWIKAQIVGGPTVPAGRRRFRLLIASAALLILAALIAAPWLGKVQAARRGDDLLEAPPGGEGRGWRGGRGTP